MTNGYFTVADSIMESSRLARSFIRARRCILGFKNPVNITINGTEYKKIKGIDINSDTNIIELSTGKESVKPRFGSFEKVEISGSGADLDVKLSE